MNKKIKFAFFGTPKIAEIVLDKLKAANMLPELIVTTPDTKAGRGQNLTEPEVKAWAKENNIPFIQPGSLKSEVPSELLEKDFDVFVVAAYGKFLPENIISIPQKGVLNIHPSMLPKYRGPSPIESQILNDEQNIGVSVMLIDEEMDHGDVVIQEEISIPDWPIKRSTLAQKLAEKGGELLVDVLPKWVAGEISAEPQNHTEATFTKKIEKSDGLINLKDVPRTNLLKVCALAENPGVYLYAQKNEKEVRVKVLDAKIENEEFVITKVIPEGKKEMSFDDFLNGGYSLSI